MPFPPILFTADELEGLCEYLSRTQYIYYPQATNFFMDLYITACRPAELLDMALWTYHSAVNIELDTLKGNLPRFFNEAQLSTDLVFSIVNNVRPYGALSYRQLKSVLYKIIPVFEVLTIEKSAIDYIFRYNLTRKLHNLGFTDAAIQSTFGWRWSGRATAYRTTDVYYRGILPPFGDDVLIDQINDFIIDSDGTFIAYQ